MSKRRRRHTRSLVALATVLVIILAEIALYVVLNRELVRDLEEARRTTETVTSLRRDARRIQVRALELQLSIASGELAARETSDDIERQLALVLANANHLLLLRSLPGDHDALHETHAALEQWASELREALAAADSRNAPMHFRESFRAADLALDELFELGVVTGVNQHRRLRRVLNTRLAMHAAMMLLMTLVGFGAYRFWRRETLLKVKLGDSERRRADLHQMAASLAHEINNQLGVIDNTVSLMRRRPPDAHLLGFLEEAGDQIRQLSQDLITFSSTGDVPGERMEVATVAREVITPFHERVAMLADQPAWIVADPAGLRRAILNLVKNGLEASGDAGRVEVEVERASGSVRILCRDRGPGLSSEEVARAGEPFFTTKARGMGLGLPIVSQFASRYGGEFRLRNRADGVRGAVAELQFPEAQPEPEPAARSA